MEIGHLNPVSVYYCVIVYTVSKSPVSYTVLILRHSDTNETPYFKYHRPTVLYRRAVFDS